MGINITINEKSEESICIQQYTYSYVKMYETYRLSETPQSYVAWGGTHSTPPYNVPL